MTFKLHIYNSLTKKKEEFKPLHSPHVGMYVCGPTVYGDAHLGHARPAVVFDTLFRYLKNSGYKVRYIRNITDVGHLENDADEGEDKVLKKARLEQLEPMEIAQFYTNSYHKAIDKLNCLTPSIEPSASGHIPEQIELIKKILEKGFAYQTDKNVYFDLEKYAQSADYGKLSGKVIEDLLSNTRDLQGQSDKRNSIDFALWKNASPEHIMKWDSPWGIGFPGWHLECSAMSRKYLGIPFDIHGGGIDLMFPHHESEIAQSVAGFGTAPCKYWIHNNLITINGQKMAKSLGNFITLDQLFTGNHPLLEQAYSPMTIRFFILQAHYRSTIDFSNDALKAAEKGLQRLFQAKAILDKLVPGNASDFNLDEWIQTCYDALNDDLNTAKLIASLFEAVRVINMANDKKSSLSQEQIEAIKTTFDVFFNDILGLIPEIDEKEDRSGDFIELLIKVRKRARDVKDFELSDIIRDELALLGIALKDGKEGTNWEKK